jgi:hypothetical protein
MFSPVFLFTGISYSVSRSAHRLGVSGNPVEGFYVANYPW